MMDALDRARKSVQAISSDLESLTNARGKEKYQGFDRILNMACLLVSQAEAGIGEALKEDPTAATPQNIEDMGYDMPPRKRGCFS